MDLSDPPWPVDARANMDAYSVAEAHKGTLACRPGGPQRSLVRIAREIFALKKQIT